jgi:nucleoside-diphosphate kinase
MEKTLLLIKPDAMRAGNAGEIIHILEEADFALAAAKIFEMDNQLADRFYAEHLGKDFYPRLRQFMQSGRIMGLILQREDAISHLREIIGNTDSSQAAEGTIRNLFGDHEFITSNAVHASDCAASAQREISLIFPEINI